GGRATVDCNRGAPQPCGVVLGAYWSCRRAWYCPNPRALGWAAYYATEGASPSLDGERRVAAPVIPCLGTRRTGRRPDTAHDGSRARSCCRATHRGRRGVPPSAWQWRRHQIRWRRLRSIARRCRSEGSPAARRSTTQRATAAPPRRREEARGAAAARQQAPKALNSCDRATRRWREIDRNQHALELHVAADLIDETARARRDEERRYRRAAEYSFRHRALQPVRNAVAPMRREHDEVTPMLA